MNFLNNLKEKVRPYAAAAIMALGGSALANNNACVSNYGTIKNPTLTQLEEIYKLDGSDELKKMPDTVSINLQGDRPYSLEELMGLKYIVAYGENNGKDLVQYGEGNNLTLLNPNAQKLEIVKGVIDSKEEAEAIANLLNYCGVESKTPFDKLTDEVERMITTYQQKTNEEIKDLKLKLDEFGKLQLEINNKITYELTDLKLRVLGLEDRVTALEKEEESEFYGNLFFTGNYSSSSTINSDPANGFGFTLGGTAGVPLTDKLAIELGGEYHSFSGSNKEQEVSRSFTDLNLGVSFKAVKNKDGTFRIVPFVNYHSQKQRAEANDYSVATDINAFGGGIKLVYDSGKWTLQVDGSYNVGGFNETLELLGKGEGFDGGASALELNGTISYELLPNVALVVKGKYVNTTINPEGANGPGSSSYTSLALGFEGEF